MSSSNSVTVQILDKEYSIICPQEERSNLVSAARYLDGKMREIRSSGKVIGADRIAVMAALNITHDLLHKQERPDVARKPKLPEGCESPFSPVTVPSMAHVAARCAS